MKKPLKRRIELLKRKVMFDSKQQARARVAKDGLTIRYLLKKIIKK